MDKISKTGFWKSLVRYRHHTLFLFFAIHGVLFWPGILVPDSLSQYQEAMAGVYSDHHPPMMAFLWRYASIFLPGAGPMFLLQLGLFYGALFFLLKNIERLVDLEQKPKFLLLVFLLPFLPQLSLYSVLIQKDNHFGGSFFFLASYFASLTLAQKRLSFYGAFLSFLILIYGISVKFQAQFLAPLFFIWMGCLLACRGPWWKKTLFTASIGILCYGSLALIAHTLVPNSQKSNSWQYVKLFDLAAISLQVKTDLLPENNKTTHYSWEKLETLFESTAIDSLAFPKDSILRKTNDPSHWENLEKAWNHAVWQYPLAYLKHRASVFSNNIFSPIGFSQRHKVLERIFPADSSAYALLDKAVVAVIFVLNTYWWIIALGFVYFGIALYGWRRSTAAPILFAFSGFTVAMCFIMFFKTMAGTPRYLYPAVMVLHGAHIFAWKVLQDLRPSATEKVSSPS